MLNLLALIEEYGYEIRDNMYYVKEKGKGKRGMQVIESMKEVKSMVSLYEKDKILNITVLKKNDTWPAELNMEYDEAPPRNDPTLYAVDIDRKSTRLNSSHITRSRMPSSA